MKPRRIKVCVLLEKKDRRLEKVRADYVGSTFRICSWSATGLISPSGIGTFRLSACCTRTVIKAADIGHHHPFLFVFQRPDRLRADDPSGCPGGTIGDLLKDLTVRFPKLGAMQNSTLAAVGLDYQDRGYVLQAAMKFIVPTGPRRLMPPRFTMRDSRFYHPSVEPRSGN